MKLLKNIYSTFLERLLEKRQKRIFNQAPAWENTKFNTNKSYNVFPLMIRFNPKDFDPNYREVTNISPGQIDSKKYFEDVSYAKEYFGKVREYMNISRVKNTLDMYTTYAKKFYNEWKPRINNLESISVSKINNGVKISLNRY